MPKVKLLKPAAGATATGKAGQTIEVTDEVAKALIDGEYAIDPDAEPETDLETEPETDENPEPKKTKKAKK